MTVNWNRYGAYGLQSIIGKTPTMITADDDEVIFYFDDKTAARLYHEQDCCESVSLEDVNGDWNDLIGTPLLVAEERSEQPEATSDWDESATWTFYTFRSVKGSVDLRWLGTSNGYYSEGVDFCMGTVE